MPKNYTLLEFLVALDTELTKLKKIVAESVGADYSELIENINGIRNELNTFKTSITDTIDTNKSEITSKFNNLEQQFNTFKTSITNTVNTNNTNITSQVNTLTSQFNEFKTRIESQVSTISSRMTNVENRVTTLENSGSSGGSSGGNVDLTEVNNRITTVEGNITTLQSDVSTAKTDITSLKSRVSSLEANQGSPGGSSGGTTGGSGEQLIFSYTHSSNKIVQPINLDYSTGIWETSEPHGLSTGNNLILDFQPPNGIAFNPLTIVKEIFSYNWSTWYVLRVEVTDDTHFKLKNATGSYLTYNQSDNNNVDFTKFRFQVPTEIQLTNLGLSQYKKLKFVARYITLSQSYTNNTKIIQLPSSYDTATPPFGKDKNNKINRLTDVSAFIYHNNSINGGIIYGQETAYRDDFIINEVNIQENKITNKSTCSVCGYKSSYTNNDNNFVTKSTTLYTEKQNCGYAQGSTFLDNITIIAEEKLLNGSYFEVYSI